MKLGNIFKRIFRGKKGVIYTLQDKPFTTESLNTISDFLKTPAGLQFCDYLLSAKFAVASKAARKEANGDVWRGYCLGFEDAINSVLAFREPPVNGNSEPSGEVALEDFAQAIDHLK